MLLIVVLWTWSSHYNCFPRCSDNSPTRRFWKYVPNWKETRMFVLALAKRFLPFRLWCLCVVHKICFTLHLCNQVKSKGLVTPKLSREKKMVKPVKTQCVHWTGCYMLKCFLCSLTLTCISLCYTNSRIHRNCTVARSERLEWCDMTFSLLWRALGDREWNVSKLNI